MRKSEHRETHEGRNYRLVVDKGGSKLQPPTGSTPEESATPSFDGNGAPRIPGDALDRPVTLAGKHLVLMFGSGAWLAFTILRCTSPCRWHRLSGRPADGSALSPVSGMGCECARIITTFGEGTQINRD